MIETKTILCNLCGGDEHQFMFKGFDRLHGFDGEFDYVKCDGCGLVFMNPQIAESELGRYYPDSYAPHNIKEKKSLNKIVKNNIRKKYLNKINAGTRVLDVGCGNGSFLAGLKSLRGCEVFGLDVSANAVEKARSHYKLDVFEGTIDKAPFESEYFDVLTAWAFIEHVTDPVGVIGCMYKLLKPGGIVVLKAPNIESFWARIFKDKWYHLDCPRHLFLYSPKTLGAMLEKAGFKVQKVAYDSRKKGLTGSLQYRFFGNNYDDNHKNKIKKSKLVKLIAPAAARLQCFMKKSDLFTIYAVK